MILVGENTTVAILVAAVGALRKNNLFLVSGRFSGPYERGGRMMNDIRDGFLLMAAFSLFLIIIAIMALGAVMRPAPWGERYRLVP